MMMKTRMGMIEIDDDAGSLVVVDCLLLTLLVGW